MNKKLTLSIEDAVIEQAKMYATKQQRSLSSIVEEYLKSLATKRKKRQKSRFSQNVEELWGSVKYKTNKSDKELLGEALLKKYLLWKFLSTLMSLLTS